MRTVTFARRSSLVVLALALATLAGCSSGGSGAPPVASARSYVGTAQGTAALVAVVADGSHVLAYVCDGVPAEPAGPAPTILAWFNGASDGRAVDVTQAGARLQLRLTDSDMAGTVTLADGRQLAVAGRTASGDAGLYRAEATGNGTTAVAGWILTSDSLQRGGVSGEGTTIGKLSGVKPLVLSSPTFSVQGLAAARIAKVGITPIPIP